MTFEKLKNILSKVIFFLAFFIIITVVLFVLSDNINIANFAFLVNIMLFFTLFVLGVIIFVTIKIRKIKKEEEIKEAEKREMDSDERLENLLEDVDQFINESRRERIGLTTRKSKSALKKTRLNIDNYKGKIKNQKCSICKLELRKKQKIIQCTECLSLFHQEHLEEWLKNESACSVCNEKIIL